MFEGVGMTDFRNVKLKVLSPEHSAAFQEAAFAAGARWGIGGNKVKRTDAKYLFTSNDDAPVFTWGDSQSEFDANKKRLISFITPAYQMTKIRIRNPEHSEFVQKKLFENGCSWGGGITKTQHADRGFLTISGNGQIRYCSEKFFNEQKHLTEIFIEDDFMEHEEEGADNDNPKNIIIGDSGLAIGADTFTFAQSIGTETSDGSTASYYELPSGATELQHLISHKNMNFFVGLIFCLCYDYSKDGHSNIRTAREIEKYATAEVERLESLQDMQRK